jgi:hypothetical protein
VITFLGLSQSYLQEWDHNAPAFVGNPDTSLSIHTHTHTHTLQISLARVLLRGTHQLWSHETFPVVRNEITMQWLSAHFQSACRLKPALSFRSGGWEKTNWKCKSVRS